MTHRWFAISDPASVIHPLGGSGQIKGARNAFFRVVKGEKVQKGEM